MLICAKPELALHFEEAGVDRIFVDLETLGKTERQAGANTFVSTHTLEDLQNIRNVLNSADLLVRINPPNPKTAEEIEAVLDAGADTVMLPYFKNRAEVESFLELLDGRATSSLLLETAEALKNAENILAAPGIDEVHVGLNDLRLTLGLKFLFEPWALGQVDQVAEIAHRYKISFGVGGIAKVGGGDRIPPELVIAEHVRVGSERVILSRSFHKEAQTVEELQKNVDVAAELQKILDLEERAKKRSATEIESDRKTFNHLIRETAKNL